MSGGDAADRVKRVGARFGSVVKTAIAAFVVLAMFAGLAFLVFRGTVEDGPLLLYAGVILGYIIHATKTSA